MPSFNKKQIDAMVNRFLGWKLPKTFDPDAGTKFTPPNGMTREEAYAMPGWWPIGTNLLTADEARSMFEHCLDATFIPEWSLLEATQDSLREHMALVKELRAQLAAARSIAEHLFIEERGDGPWLVCVEKVFDTEDDARAACRRWKQSSAGNAGVPACRAREPGVDIEPRFCTLCGAPAVKGGACPAGVQSAPDNRTRPLTDQAQPWTPEHCKTCPRRASEEIEYLRGVFGVALALLSEAIGPLEVSAAVIESEDGGEAIETFIDRLRKFVADALGSASNAGVSETGDAAQQQGNGGPRR